jgi:hypothetical protein
MEDPMAVTPRPVTTAPDSDPRPTGNAVSPRPATVAGGKAHWDALTTEAIATGGLTWQQVAHGFDPVNDVRSIRTMENLPVRDV